eukprot:symbB.v1.2.040612.t1/scaffold7375.1/size11630/3
MRVAWHGTHRGCCWEERAVKNPLALLGQGASCSHEEDALVPYQSRQRLISRNLEDWRKQRFENNPEFCRCISEHVKRSVVSLYELSRGGRNDPLRVNRPVFRPMARVLIHRAIEQGAPAYNAGQVERCMQIYQETSKELLLKHRQELSSSVATALEDGVQISMALFDAEKNEA